MARALLSPVLVLGSSVLGTGCLDLVGAQVLEDATMTSTTSTTSTGCDEGPLAHLWSQKVGGPDIERIQGAAVLPDGSAVFTGYAWSTMNVGGSLVSPGAFVFKTSGAGDVLWAKGFGEVQGAVGLSLALDGQGDVVLTGFASKPIDFGGGVLSPPQQMDVIAKLSGESGDHLWSELIGGGVDLTVNTVVALDSAGDAVIAGQYEGTLGWPHGDVLSVPGGVRDCYLSHLDPSGKHVWSRDCGPHAIPKQILVTGDGDILLLGATTGPADLGGNAALGGNRSFLARFTSEGTLLWSREIGASTVGAFGRGMAIRKDGTIVVAVPFSELLDLGEQPFETSSLDVAVVSFTPQGEVVWARHFGGAGEDSPWGLTITSDDEIVIGGTFQQEMDPGPGLCPVDASKGHNAFLLDLDAAGNPRWIRSFGGTSVDSGDPGAPGWPSEIVTTVGAAADGSIVIAGEMDGIVSWGSGAFAAASPGDLVIARYSR